MPTYPARRAAPSAVFTHHDRIDGEVTLIADAEGVVRPRTEAEARIADAHELPVIRERATESTDEKKETKR